MATNPALRTPSDLSTEATAAVISVLNPLIADAIALWLKTKNYHWHVTGPHFRDYHVLLDDQAAGILATVDPLAERVRKLGGRTITSIGHVAQ
ncbi:MAG: ferritin-like domain-containing protein, partial [Bacteroidota bacterium]